MSAVHHTRRIGIIGGGFSGSAVAMHLLALCREGVAVDVFEPRPSIGLGVAYGDCSEAHLLNVPAGKLTAWPAKSGQFHEWVLAQKRPSTPATFHPRGLFGTYMQAQLEDARATSGERSTLRHIAQRAISIRVGGDRLAVRAEDGSGGVYDHVVLAVGHGPVRCPPALRSAKAQGSVLGGPWNQTEMADVARRAKSVLLVGIGLTMIDAVGTLERRGYKGLYTALSRRGLSSRSHGPSQPDEYAPWAASLQGGDIVGLVREIRSRATPHNWRSIIDSMRPHTARLWQTLSPEQRDSFMRHLSAHWDAHRHRCPAETFSEIEALRRSGRLRTIAATIRECAHTGHGVRAVISPRGNTARLHESFDTVILCTGPESDPRKWGSQLIDDALGNGLVTVDPNGLGLAVTSDGRVIDALGSPHDRLSLVGPAAKANFWESTAIPELGRHAESVAKRIAASADTQAERASNERSTAPPSDTPHAKLDVA